MTIELFDPANIESIGYVALFVVMALDGANLPFTPVELFLGLAGYLAAIGEVRFFPALLVTVAGNVAGNLVSYLIGSMVGRPFFTKYGKYFFVSPERLETAEEMARFYGPIAILFFRVVPGLRSIGSLLFGTMRVPFVNFLIYSTIGILIWNSTLMILGFYFGEAFQAESRWLVPLAFLVIAGGFTLTAIFWYLVGKKRDKSAQK